ncbi:hypothetical protein [Microbacterium sp. LWH11-1.2]|uniref:hypothetical protein n=1 Tax=Microbacterium sp. LWH11-1.2 TaxID=3135258 RepID=UPI003138C682
MTNLEEAYDAAFSEGYDAAWDDTTADGHSPQLETLIDEAFAPDCSERVDEAERFVFGPVDDV